MGAGALTGTGTSSAATAASTFGGRLAAFAASTGQDVTSLLVEAALQPSTLADYTRTMNDFKEFMDTVVHLPWQQATPLHVCDFISVVLENSQSSGEGVVKKVRSALGHFYREARLQYPAADYTVAKLLTGVRKLATQDGHVREGAPPIGKAEITLMNNAVFAKDIFTSYHQIK